VPASRHASHTPPTPIIARAEPKAHGSWRLSLGADRSGSGGDRIDLQQFPELCLMTPVSRLAADQAEVSFDTWYDLRAGLSTTRPGHQHHRAPAKACLICRRPTLPSLANIAIIPFSLLFNLWLRNEIRSKFLLDLSVASAQRRTRGPSCVWRSEDFSKTKSLPDLVVSPADHQSVILVSSSRLVQAV
jgi:hypothetical protein